MYLGRLVEVADCCMLFSRPRHPYTEALLSIIPRPDPRKKTQKSLLKGSIADASHLPSGCTFHPRCRYAEDQCRVETPELRSIAPGHQVTCHFNLDLPGIETR
jgi:oligopeptide/dipeptide ABC transporter ATP-binding protein